MYTSLQTGVVNAAENGINVYFANKHYEVAPMLSMTEHEANNSRLWVSDKTCNSLSDQEKQWVLAAAEEVVQDRACQSGYAGSGIRHQAQGDRREDRRNVDKSGFMKSPTPSWTSSPRTSVRTRSRSMTSSANVN